MVSNDCIFPYKWDTGLYVLFFGGNIAEIGEASKEYDMAFSDLWLSCCSFIVIAVAADWYNDI